MAVRMRQHMWRLRGGAQSHLMLGADGMPWVVKFQGNPQDTRVLANDFLGTRIAAAVGLSTPQIDVVEVSEWLSANSPEMEFELGAGNKRCPPGLHFGSRYAAGLMPGQVLDYMPAGHLAEVRNLEEFAGILLVDKWLSNSNGRQAVFIRRPREKRYKAVFIDFGHCFTAHLWKFEDPVHRGVAVGNTVYQGIRGWDSFEPWMTRIEKLPEQTIWEAANEIPPEWYGGNPANLEMLVEKMLKRKNRETILELVACFGRSDRSPFPNWSGPVRL